MSRRESLTVSAALHSVSFMLVSTAGLIGQAGIVFWTGALIFSGMLVYQHLIVKPDDLSRVNRAFATTNGVAGVIFGLAVIVDLLIFRT
jgi:4-hydroxybenzoate polyprenyltransferase